jgi:hypothetical protein
MAHALLRDSVIKYDTWPLPAVMAQLTQICMYEKERLRCTAFKLITAAIPKCCENTTNPASSNVIRKNIFPAITAVIVGSTGPGGTGGKGEVRTAAAECLKEIQKCCPMGEKVWTWVNDVKQQEDLRKCIGAN